MQGKRARILKKGITQNGPVLYWMQRAQRIQDNWSLLYACEYAKAQNQPVIIVFNLFPAFLDATLRQFDFMLKGLEEVATEAKSLNFEFLILFGDPVSNLSKFIHQNNISALFTDFNPLKLIRESKKALLEKIQIPVFEVDSSNIVPAWIASEKLEFAAYTLRPKIKKLLPEFLTEIPLLPIQKEKTPLINLDNLKRVFAADALSELKIDMTVLPVKWLIPGTKAALAVLDKFINTKIASYDVSRNDPNRQGQSDISPYLHFGQLSTQRVAWNIASLSAVPIESKEAYLEELIVRRELADNYCYYNSNYDNFNGFHQWAQKTLNEHRFDKREYIYTFEEFEHSKTHDPLWNAAQKQMVLDGKMHGFLRMYWAKKILEWTPSPEEAQAVAVYLNDKYELDGIDPNGYTGINWSIGGIHDRAWGERPVFGKIRFMNYAGCKRKFDVLSFQEKYS